MSYLYDAFSRRVEKRITRKNDRGQLDVTAWRFVWNGNHIGYGLQTSAADNGDPIVEERTFGFSDSQFEPMYQTSLKRGSTNATTLHYVTDQVGAVDCLVDQRVAPVGSCNRSVFERMRVDGAESCVERKDRSERLVGQWVWATGPLYSLAPLDAERGKEEMTWPALSVWLEADTQRPRRSSERAGCYRSLAHIAPRWRSRRAVLLPATVWVRFSPSAV